MSTDKKFIKSAINNGQLSAEAQSDKSQHPIAADQTTSPSGSMLPSGSTVPSTTATPTETITPTETTGSPGTIPTSVPLPSMEEVFKRLGGLRDGMLVSGGIIYLLGRLVWAYQSQRFNQGIVSVEQSQYFVAGFVPAAIVILVWLGIRGVKSALQMISRLYEPNASRRRRILQKALAATYTIDGVACCCVWAGNYLWPHRHFLPPTSLGYAISFITLPCIFMAGLPLLVRVYGTQASKSGNQVPESALSETMQQNKTMQQAIMQQDMQLDPPEWAMIALYPVIVGVVAICVYGGLVYPRLTQEYGGALPRVAYLDLDRSKLSADTLKDLVPPEAVQSKTPTVRTVLLDVFFAGKDTLLVKPYRKWTDNRTYEIQGGSVLSRTWADPAKFRP